MGSTLLRDFVFRLRRFLFLLADGASPIESGSSTTVSEASAAAVTEGVEKGFDDGAADVGAVAVDDDADDEAKDILNCV